LKPSTGSQAKKHEPASTTAVLTSEASLANASSIRVCRNCLGYSGPVPLVSVKTRLKELPSMRSKADEWPREVGQSWEYLSVFTQRRPCLGKADTAVAGAVGN